jgi:hypothetical protein
MGDSLCLEAGLIGLSLMDNTVALLGIKKIMSTQV